MDYFDLRLEDVPLRLPDARAQVIAFLVRQGLTLDRGLTRYCGAFHGERLVGGAGYDGCVIKCVAVDPDYRGEGIVNALISRLLSELAQNGVSNAFLYTKPSNGAQFDSLGFSRVEQTEKVLLLESDPHGFSNELSRMTQLREPGKTGAIVMNCNPFTLGHQHLIETAAAQCERLLVFAVQEDVSAFPFETRLRLLREGTMHIPRVTVVPSGAYMISAATFPSYFLNDGDDAAEACAALDLRIFGHHIAPAAGISIRFAGEEPFSRVTALYHQQMQHCLPPVGVQVQIVVRRQADGQVISASRVRRLLAQDRLDEVRTLVPACTFRYLSSAQALPTLQRLRRHSRCEGRRDSGAAQISSEQ